MKIIRIFVLVVNLLVLPVFFLTGSRLSAQSSYQFIARYADMKYNGETVIPTCDPVGLGPYVYLPGMTDSGYALFRFDSESAEFSVFPVTGAGLAGKLIIAADSLDAGHLWVLVNTSYDIYSVDVETGEAILLSATEQNTRSAKTFRHKLFFSKYTENYGDELWVSDGPGSEDRLFENLNPGVNTSQRPRSSSPAKFFIFNGNLWFHALRGGEMEKSWYCSTDGENAVVPHFSLQDLSSEYYLMNSTHEVVWGDHFYFAALKSTEYTGAMYLFASNGTLEGTRVVMQLPLKSVNEMTVIDDKLWMIGNPADGTGDGEIVVFDGENTTMVRIAENKSSYFNNLLKAEGKILVFGRDPRFNSLTNGYVLYAVNDELQVTKQNIYNTSSKALVWSSPHKPFIVHHGKAYMTGWSRINALDEFVNVEGINLSHTELHLYVGQQAKLKASVYPINATFQDVYFQSSNTYSADVDESGWVTGIAKGYAEIGIRDMMYSRSLVCKVYVEEIPASVEQPVLESPLLKYDASDRTLTITGGDLSELLVFDLSGTMVFRSGTGIADLGQLPRGCYLVRAVFSDQPDLCRKIVVY